MLCKLCQTECSRLARSHIVARGFFSRTPDGKRLYTACGDGDSRKLQNALWDSNLVCDKCEHDFFAPLDDYAIKVYSRFENATLLVMDDGLEMKMFEDANRCMLRAFFASLLWRCSISKLHECGYIDIGDAYNKRIAAELLGGGKFEYIDAIVIGLKNQIHSGMLLSGRTRLGLGATGGINGFNLSIPYLRFIISIDKRPHPLRDQLNGTVDLNGGMRKCSASLSNEAMDSNYWVPVVDFLPSEVGNIIATFSMYLKNTKHVRTNVK